MEPIRARPLIARTPARRGGFTLVEMMVSLSIIFIISAIALTGQSTFNQSILLNDTSYTVALSARQAQSLGLSSRKFSGVQNGGYGIHFSSATPNSYTLFADVQNTLSAPAGCPTLAAGLLAPETKAGNCLYDGVGETFQSYMLSRGFTISNFCGKAGSLLCSSAGQLQTLDMVFIRPNTVSIITGITPGNSKVTFTCAQITVKSPTGAAVQTIRVSSLGEISVGQVCP